MNKIIVLLSCLGCAFPSFADLIVTRSSANIDCKVLTVNDNLITYRISGETFDRELPISDVFKIKYDNGEEDNFANTFVKTEPSGEMLSSEIGRYINIETEPDWSVLPPAQRKYQIGDWYDENGVEGIVIWTTPDGLHGRIVHKDKWNVAALFKKPVAFFTGPTDVCLGMPDLTNGYANMLALKDFMIRNPQYTMEMFPVQEILSQLGDGWYLPSIKELEYFYILRNTNVAYNGSNPKFCGKTVPWHKIINSVSKEHGGKKHDEYCQLSSTETFCQNPASGIFKPGYGYPTSQQFALFKFTEGEECKPIVRNKGYIPFYAFHLF